MKKTHSYTWLNFVVFTIFLGSCASLNQRNPSSDGEYESLIFNSNYNKSHLKARYSFQLINLNKLALKQIVFSDLKINDIDAAKSVANWIEELRHFTDATEKKSEFKNKDVQITVKKSSLENVIKALDLLTSSGADPQVILRQQIEIISAFNNNFKSPLENNGSVELGTILFQILGRLVSLPIHEKNRDQYLELANSSYWTDRRQLGVDMALGAGSGKMIKVMKKFESLYGQSGDAVFNEACEYEDAKRGYGIHMGFKIKCFDVKFKLKLGEAKGGPLDSKLYYRLGYNVPGIFYVNQVNVKYDRRILTESDARKSQYLKLRLIGLPIGKFKIKKQSDIERVISYAVLKDGTRVTVKEFLDKLLPACADIKCHLDDSLYNSEFESQIAYLGFNNVAVLEDKNDFEFGSWAYDDLEHKDRTEVNSIAFLGAFTGNVDLRKDNTRLIWNKKSEEVQHALSDPGRGLGKGSIFSSHFNLNNFHWEMVEEQVYEDQNNPNQNRKYLVIKGYKPFAKHKTFKQIDVAEARWMARQIASITEDELTEAIITSGFNMAEMLLIREKLVSSQKNLVEVLKIAHEFPNLQTRIINKKINYLPTGQVQTINLANGRSYQVPEEGASLSGGKISMGPASESQMSDLDELDQQVYDTEF